MGIFVIGTACYAYKKKSMEFDKKVFSKSALASTFAVSLFGVLQLPILFELLLVVTITKLFRKQVLDNAGLQAFIKENVFDRVQEKKGRNMHLVRRHIQLDEKKG